MSSCATSRSPAAEPSASRCRWLSAPLEESVTVSADAPATLEATCAGWRRGRRRGRRYRRCSGRHRPGRLPVVRADFNTETYDHIDEGGLRRVADNPLSTFSIDVDTASYANVRRFLTDGSLPPAGAVRIEELINYFRFDYPQPDGDDPFSVTTELAVCPWNPSRIVSR